MKHVMNKKNLIWALVGLIVVIGVFAGIYFGTRPEAQVGDKTITVQIVKKDSERTVEINTDAEMLGEALLQEELVVGDMGDYGLFITAVDGYEADSAAQEWWCITKGGEDVFTGADTTPIADGDAFEITLKTGW